MIRNIVGSVLALAGATAAVWSPFRAWYDGRHGRDYAIDELFTGITDAKAEVIGSILLPFAFAALLTLVGVLFRSRALVALAGIVVLGFTVLWMVRVGQAEGSLTVGGDGQGLGIGVANAFGGGVLLLLGAVVMSGRRGRRRTARVDQAPAPAPVPVADPDPADPYPADPYPVGPYPGGDAPTATYPTVDTPPPDQPYPPDHRPEDPQNR
ncbi:hypothetical protein [Streptomyces sp. NPDC090025]|uniref:hypothetical protein n=1 Tax=Streptomyces sp. NPDC090025 TaxID=3365922 RepID=UPI0038358D60